MPLTNYRGFLLIATFTDTEELHYPTLEERETEFQREPFTGARPQVRVRPPAILGLFASQEQAEEYVLEAQRQADPEFFGPGVFAILPVDCFATHSEIDRG